MWTNRRQMAVELKLRTADAADANAIAALLREAFEPRFLINSVYATPGGARWLGRQLAEPEEFPSLRVRVAETADGLGGVTISQVAHERLHLDYIAVDSRCVGRGLGSVLMKDLLAARGVVSLDVFAANERAFQWYRALGFVQTAAHDFRAIDLSAVTDAAPPITTTRLREDARDAQRQAAQWGFGRLDTFVAAVPVGLTLLGEAVVRVRTCPEEHLPGLAAAVAVALPERRLMVLPPDLTAGLQLAVSEEVVRMELRDDR